MMRGKPARKVRSTMPACATSSSTFIACSSPTRPRARRSAGRLFSPIVSPWYRNRAPQTVSMTDLGVDALLGLYRVAGFAAMPLLPAALSMRAARGKEDRARIGERFGRQFPRPAPGAAGLGPCRERWRDQRRPAADRAAWSAAASPSSSPPSPSARRGSPPPGCRRAPSTSSPRSMSVRSSAASSPIGGRPSPSSSNPSNGRRPSRSSRLPAFPASSSMRASPTAPFAAGSASAAFPASSSPARRSASPRRRAMPSAMPRSACRNASVSGNLKFDVPPPAADAAEVAAFRAAIGERPAWLAASTHDGEEAIVARAHRLLAAAHPRSPDAHRSAPPRTRAGDRRHAGRRGAFRRPPRRRRQPVAVDRHLCRRHARRTRPLLPSVAGRLHRRLAGAARRPEPHRARRPRHRRPPRPPRAQFRRHLRRPRPRPARPKRSPTRKALPPPSSGLLDDPALARRRAAAAAPTLRAFTGALEATLHALEPWIASPAEAPGRS